MKYSILILSGAIILTAAVGSTIAAVTFLGQSAPMVSPSIDQPRSATADRSTPDVAVTDSLAQPLQAVNPPTQEPEFAEFLQQLKQAVRDRDAQFVREHVTPETQFSFGTHRTINYLNPDNPNSPFWTQLEQALNACQNEGNVFSCSSRAQDAAPADQQSYRAKFAKENGKWIMQAFLTEQ